MGKKVFQEFNIWDQVNLALTMYCPNLATKLGIRNIQKDVSKFFFKSVKDTVEYREKNNIHRDDFLQLLMELKNSEVKLSMNELTAQAFLFFLAGFGTSSTVTTQALYELGKNEEVQSRARDEIIEILGQHDNKITYESLAEMKYLEQVIDVLGLQHDPDYWPDPLKWDPDRFGEENGGNKHSFTYLPFGEGPRNCIGMRFGLMQTKIGLITVLKNFKVSVSPRTVTPLGMDPDTFLFHTINKVYLNLDKI
ncbi:hypothetical protein NQ314_014746 [Rhamnusium bicolor]|uniref:Cytochrome P450 n=1 Tax=Rhamnusium bicolor TaxID=1586634 RepID=A0AAV8X0Z9_9CUCU|nr:hypothetical protein NQ314_014746 [Rhamnusium bicolor]